MGGQLINQAANHLIHKGLVITGANLAFFVAESVATDHTLRRKQ
jgi:hypothetical protein